MKSFTFFIAAAFVLGLFAGPTFAQQGTGGQQQQPGMGGQQEQERQQQPGMTGQQEQQRQQQPQQQQQRETMGQQAQQGQQVSPDQLSSDQVRELQQSLQAQGVSPGPIDGIMGPMTEQAIREFQQEQGIAATGQLNEQTLEALDLEVEEFMGAAPAFEDQQRQQQQQQERQQQPQQQQQQEGQQEGIQERMQDRQQQDQQRSN
jgi:peptidoglycan hydrolase-like protein with peptidoglycan-binding domain